ncbi:hypothetical protein [Nocardioides bruguierae]|uniref:Uncharacterized protein n=1 Tax=Nocardioides bruguierae TaxID=2945102 RepID=A0A9X2D567_9ACTN|nr:hypothetical protein [Nocardioides bruguierae]MCM0619204.1 hypothetical protein [Nocardioides bruguierae]
MRRSGVGGTPRAALVPARLLALALVLALGLGGLAACTGQDEAEGPDTPTSPPSASVEEGETLRARPVRTTVEVGTVVGALPFDRRRQVAASVGRAADAWIDGAFVQRRYPRPGSRQAFQGAFSSFTRSTARQAAADRRLTTAAAVSARVDDLVAVRRRVLVDVLSVKRVPRAATARVGLVYATDGRVRDRFLVQARLAMTHDAREGWQVVAYDVTQARGAAAAPRAGGQKSGQQDKQKKQKAGQKTKQKAKRRTGASR